MEVRDISSLEQLNRKFTRQCIKKKRKTQIRERNIMFIGMIIMAVLVISGAYFLNTLLQNQVEAANRQISGAEFSYIELTEK